MTLSPLIKMRSEQEGFSLVELLVVVLFIAVLAVVMIPSFLGQRDSAKNNNAIHTVKHAQEILADYFLRQDENFCARAEDGLQAGCGKALTDDLNTLQAGENAVTWINGSGINGNDTTNIARINQAQPGTTPARSGDSNDDKTVYIESVAAGRYGGVSFCVGSRGSKNYCGAWLSNNRGKFWTLSTGKGVYVSNVLIALGWPQVTPGNNSTSALVVEPQVNAGAAVNQGLRN